MGTFIYCNPHTLKTYPFKEGGLVRINREYVEKDHSYHLTSIGYKEACKQLWKVMKIIPSQEFPTLVVEIQEPIYNHNWARLPRESGHGMVWFESIIPETIPDLREYE